MTQLITQIQSDYGYSFASMLPYDHSPSDYPNARNYLGGDDPMVGTWLAHEISSYPTPNGRVVLGPRDGNRRITYTAQDLTNGLSAEGQYQAFWGVQDLRTTNNLQQVPVAMLMEGIVSLNGTPKYRVVQSVTGSLIRGNFVVSGRNIAVRNIAISASYHAVNVETLDSADTRVPCLFNACGINYQAVWLKQ